MKSIGLLCFSLLFIIASPGAHAGQEAGKGVITGRLLTKEGTPLSGGQVFFFNEASGPPPSQEKYWRVPDHFTRIDEQGKFFIELSEGKYYLGAIKRVSGEKIGPPREGDFFFAGADEKGLPKTYVVKNAETIDIGVISEAVPFQKKSSQAAEEMTAIEGTVVNTDGKPVEGAVVLANTTPEMRGKRPIFTSERTGKDGRYLLKVHDEGNYYLRVRSMKTAGPPVAGELIGIYGEKEPVAVVVKKGRIIKGIDIKVYSFEGRKTENEQSPSAGRQIIK